MKIRTAFWKRLVLFIILMGVGVVYGESPDTNKPLPSGDNSLEIKTQIPSFPKSTNVGNQHHQIAEANSDGGVVEVVVGMFILVLCISTFNSLRSGVVDGFKGAKAKRDDAPTLYWGFIALHIVFIALLVRFLSTYSF